MAFSGTNANLNWQQVKIALDALGANGFSQDAFRALKAYLGQVKGNPNLQFLAFTEADCDAGGGTVLLTGACRVYGVFIKKEAEGTDNIFFLYDDATNDGTAADAVVGLSVLESAQEAVAIYPTGLPMATGVLVTQYLSSSGLGAGDGSNGGNGFVLIGAA